MMITFDNADIRFTYRAAGVVIRDGAVLFERAVGDGGFLFLPGGRIELLESADQTVVRELQEELGVTVTAPRLLWFVESFFVLGPRRTHEVALYFLCGLPETHLRFEAGRTFEWHPLSSLASLDVRPAFLKADLLRLPAIPEHRVVREGVPSPVGPMT
jgi:8-oxo-dGTP pyrophosphatase MutT (NUDIX family)